MTAHFDKRAAGIAALAESDPERAAAEAHAASCTTCAAALAEGAMLVAMLDALPALPPPSPAALARTRNLILDGLAGARSDARPVASVWGPAAAALVAGGIFTAVARHRSHDPRAWIEAAAGLLVAAVAAAVGARKGTLAGWMTLLASGALVLVAAMGDGVAARIGAKCLLIELLAASAPYAIVAWGAIRRRCPTSALAFATTAAAGALAGQAALQLSCQAHAEAPHLVLFHLGGVLLAGALGSAGAGPIARRAARVSG